MKYRISHFLVTLALLLAVGSLNAFAEVEVKTPDYYDQNVRSYFKAEKWSEGKKLLEEGMKLYSSLSNLNELEGWYYYHYKKYDQSRFYLIRSLRADNANTHARELLINVEEETKNYSSAICYVNEMLEFEPYALRFWRRKISLYRKQGNNDEADRLLARLRIIYPNVQQVKVDVAYQYETQYRNAKKVGDIPAQIAALRELIKLQPKEEEFYLVLSNLLLQTGHNDEAAEVAGQGAAALKGNLNLIKKKAAILVDAGRYTEALNYIKTCQQQYRTTALNSYYNELQLEAARAAQANDAYSLYAKVYATNPSAESLDFLLNTAIARGYYEDALTYLRDAKKGRGETEELLYKEYIVNQRLGNKTAATNLLVKLYQKNPKNADVADLLARIHFEQAAELMGQGQYGEAIPQLQFAVDATADEDIKKAALLRLFNCYYMNRDYNNADAILDKYNTTYGFTAYTTQKATILSLQGKTREALDMLYKAYKSTNDQKSRDAIATAYEELATPYIKRLIQIGATRQAYNAADQAVELCPNSADILRMAITTSSLLDMRMSYINYVAKARANFPNDPEFIAKEAAIYSMTKEYDKALSVLRPQLDVYEGDSTIIGAFSENSENYANALRKQKHPYEAMAVIDTALVFDNQNRSLLYTKGLIFEDIHEYDSAYVYQSYYTMTLADYSLTKRRLNEILYKSYSDELYIEYQQARLGSEDAITGNATLAYTRKYPKNIYTGTINYAGRDGLVDDKNKTDLTRGGIGIQLNAAWQHMFKPYLSGKAEIGWANKFFPQFVLKASGTMDLANEWVVGAGLSYRRLQSYKGVYGWKENDNGQGGSTMEYQRLGWKQSYMNMFVLNGNASKTLNKFALSGGLDLFLLNEKSIYVNANAKAQFFPVIGDRTNVYTTFSIGNAPATVLIDRSLPAGFNHVNTSVGLGGLYVVNQHLTLGLAGDWYTLFNKAEGLYTGMYEVEPSIISSYKNYFYVHAQVLIAF